jgi:hypothetical protein
MADDLVLLLSMVIAWYRYSNLPGVAGEVL